MDRIARCHCGSLQIATTGEPAWVNACHCAACQRRTGAIIHSGCYFAVSLVRVEGASKIYARSADSGYEMRFHFCPDCGSNVYWHASRFPSHIGVAVGAFADPDFPQPAFSVFQALKHRWLSMPTEVQQFDHGRVGAPLGTGTPTI